MSVLDGLIEDHKKLRKMAAEISALARERGGSATGFDAEFLAQLGGLERDLHSFLKTHEEQEDGLLQELLVSAPRSAGTLVNIIRSDHASLRDVFQVLSLVTGPEGGGDAYTIRFVVASLVSQLERHMAFEEAETFPLIRRLFSPNLLEDLARRAALIQGPRR